MTELQLLTMFFVIICTKQSNFLIRINSYQAIVLVKILTTLCSLYHLSTVKIVCVCVC